MNDAFLLKLLIFVCLIGISICIYLYFDLNKLD